MQIRNIILYKDAERMRILPFDLGKVNIITGESKSGKTALINIVDYFIKKIKYSRKLTDCRK